MIKAPDILRHPKRDRHERVTFIELFFDLVFVFAVTQVSHSILEHLDGPGILHGLMMIMAVWWVWVYTAWVTNWFDPEKNPVRILLLVMMLAGLILSSSIPQAFDGRALSFAFAYVFIQVGRSLFCLWGLRGNDKSNFQNFQRITSWLALSGIIWIAGGFASPPLRTVLWAFALAVEYAGPFMGFRVPGLGRSETTDWSVEGGHLAERCALFIIIALGESVLLTGSTFAKQEWHGESLAAFLVAFLGSVVMWWIYFDISVELGTERISHSADPGRIARFAYTYIHLPIIAGIIVCAVADEILLLHPHDPVSWKYGLPVLGGPALYLAGSALFKWSLLKCLPGASLAGLGLLAVVAMFAVNMNILICSTAALAAMLVTAAWESITLRRTARKRLAEIEPEIEIEA